MASKSGALRKLVFGAALVFSLFFVVVGVLLLAEYFYGGPHATTVGESYGFRIGMSKAEVFHKYMQLNRGINIQSYGPNGLENVILERKTECPTTFQLSDHWMAYGRPYPVWFQEFFFSDTNLVKIITYIRFYETP